MNRKFTATMVASQGLEPADLGHYAVYSMSAANLKKNIVGEADDAWYTLENVTAWLNEDFAAHAALITGHSNTKTWKVRKNALGFDMAKSSGDAKYLLASYVGDTAAGKSASVEKNAWVFTFCSDGVQTHFRVATFHAGSGYAGDKATTTAGGEQVALDSPPFYLVADANQSITSCAFGKNGILVDVKSSTECHNHVHDLPTAIYC